MASESESALLHVHIPHLDSVVHTAGKKEIALVMEGYFPHRLTVLCKGLCATSMNEVPDFDATIT